jgi:predicted pyridoxine 5'-phosphate oxidase superfamily flavin-nucleotide-binding protein
MKLTAEQMDLLTRRKLVVLATSSSDDNQMNLTRKNLLENKNVFILAWEEDYSYGLKISGEAKYYSNSGYFDFVKRLETNKGFSPKGAVVVAIKEVVALK